MAGASESFHESEELLSEQTKEMHRALVSVQEELEAVDWYQQRADASSNEELRGLLLHNMREEIEHACMVLEWLRRNHPDFAQQMSIYLFSDKPILEAEESDKDLSDARADDSGGTLNAFTIGTMKGASS
ncbi:MULTISPECIES: encapsulin-associated ferritin-like protein [Marinobacter]|uniref:encapsulin-associated ferritin-like protein n=1 Tax=Marinobacter TaxID=2742 RepID=UPI000DAE066D|nr:MULTISPECIES: encapsulin-associated ferritin-like protein [Marinobacter]